MSCADRGPSTAIGWAEGFGWIGAGDKIPNIQYGEERMRKDALVMTIEITRPEVQALIRQRLQAGGFESPEELIFQALQEFHPKRAASAGKRTFADICSKIRGAAEELDLTRDGSPGRDILL